MIMVIRENNEGDEATLRRLRRGLYRKMSGNYLERPFNISKVSQFSCWGRMVLTD